MPDALDEYVEGKKQLIDARYHRIVARDGPPKHKHERVGYLELAATKVVGDVCWLSWGALEVADPQRQQLKGRDFGGKVDPDAAEKLVVKELEFVTRK